MLFKTTLIKRLLLKIKYGYKSDSNSYRKFLIKRGIKIGNNVSFNSPWTLIIDYLKPWLLEIGSNVIIAGNVSIITHGADWRVLQNLYGDVIGSGDKITIGNNVFIGIGSTILKGVTIGDNVIIGAGSIVTKDLKSNGVYAGNPARLIMSLKDYYIKRKQLQPIEFMTNIKEYYSLYGNYPDKKAMREYFWLYTRREKHLEKYLSEINNECADPVKCNKKYYQTKPIYESYESVLEKTRNEEQQNI